MDTSKSLDIDRKVCEDNTCLRIEIQAPYGLVGGDMLDQMTYGYQYIGFFQFLQNTLKRCIQTGWFCFCVGNCMYQLEKHCSNLNILVLVYERELNMQQLILLDFKPSKC